MKLKTILLTVIAAVIFALTPLTAFGRSSQISDWAAIVQDDYAAIDDALWESYNTYDVHVWIHTADTLDGMTLEEYSDKWCDSFSVGEDVVGLVVCTNPRSYQIITQGDGIRAFTDAGLDFIEEQIVPLMSKGDYDAAFMMYAELCYEYLEQAATGKPYDVGNLPEVPKVKFDVGKSLLIALGVGAAAGGIGVLMLFSNLKSVHRQSGAADYRKRGSFQLETKRDMYLYKKVKREAKPHDNGGGSTTRTSGSGETRGGTSGTF